MVSIILLVYNAEATIGRCLDSILNQTYSKFEIVIVNDGSEDSSKLICQKYVAANKNIKLINIGNTSIGASEARNVGIKYAGGDYLAFIDSDDIIHPSYLMYLTSAIKKFKSKMSMCRYSFFYDSKSTISKPGFIDKPTVSLLTSEGVISKILDDQALTACWGKLFSKELFRDVIFPVGRYNEDMFVIPFIIAKAKSITFVDHPLYYYNQATESLVREKFNYKKLDLLKAKKLWINLVDKQYPKLINKSLASYYSSTITLCQYLISDSSKVGRNILYNHKNELKKNFKNITKSRYIPLRNKFKLVLIMIGVFESVFRLIIFLNIKKYNRGF